MAGVGQLSDTFFTSITLLVVVSQSPVGQKYNGWDEQCGMDATSLNQYVLILLCSCVLEVVFYDKTTASLYNQQIEVICL